MKGKLCVTIVMGSFLLSLQPTRVQKLLFSDFPEAISSDAFFFGPFTLAAGPGFFSVNPSDSPWN